MTKAELIERVSAQAEMPADAAERAVDAALAVITRLLANDDTLVLRGFGKFWVTHRSAHSRSNLSAAHNGKQRAPRFGAAAPFKRKLNEKGLASEEPRGQAADHGGGVQVNLGPTHANAVPKSYSLMRAVNSPTSAASLVVVSKRAGLLRSFPYRPQGL